MSRTQAIMGVCVLLALVIGALAQEVHHTTDEIARLIDSAEPGSTVIVPAGVYEGNLRIEKAIVLDGQGLVTIDGLGKGSVVEIGVGDVTFRGFTVKNSGSTVDQEPAGIRAFAGPVIIENNHLEDVYFGIDLRPAADSVIRNNTVVGKELKLGRRGDGIRLWWSHNTIVEDNTIDAVRDMVFWYSEDLSVARNVVTNSRYGLHFMYSHNTTLRENELTSNSVGIYLMYSNNIHLVGNSIVNNRGTSGYGIGLKDCDAIVVENNALLANRVGMYIDNSPSSVDSFGIIRNNKVAFNEIGMLSTPITHDNVITNNAFVENEEQVTVHGRGQLMLNEFSADGVGNFWSDYSGFDQDNDGVGDFPHEPRSLFRSLLARQPNLRIFLHSPAQQAIELTARAFPELSPKPIFIDHSPLTRPPELDLLVSSQQTSRVPMVGFAVGLLLISGISGWLIAHQPRLPVLTDSDLSQRAFV
ncbi:MAG: nitrous oxide reductase family maturation protein NosD [Phycisphaerales bacterium]|nr:nitrous oxide reductase family maturation protein NosD [Phycisphaerales bacterium]